MPFAICSRNSRSNGYAECRQWLLKHRVTNKSRNIISWQPNNMMRRIKTRIAMISSRNHAGARKMVNSMRHISAACFRQFIAVSQLHSVTRCNDAAYLRVFYKLTSDQNTCHTKVRDHKWIQGLSKEWRLCNGKNHKQHLHATSIVADWLFAFPRGDQAWQSHLNGDLPKYSNTKSFEMVAVTSCSWTPVCGSTCESNVDGGGCELPLHLNVSWKKKKQNELQLIKLKLWITACVWFSVEPDAFTPKFHSQQITIIILWAVCNQLSHLFPHGILLDISMHILCFVQTNGKTRALQQV